MSFPLTLRVLPPVGEPIRLGQPMARSPQMADLEQRLQYAASGTAALALILATLAQRARDAGSAANEVLIPAYGCPDIVSAVAFAGLRARLVDLADSSPFPSIQAWSGAIDSQTLALVTVGFLGLRDPFSPEQAAAAGLAAGAFIEDCCQVHPMAATVAPDRNVALSFGRGKPVSLMHGGAALLAEAILPWRCKVSVKSGGTAGYARLAVLVRLYNLLRSPWLYGWVTRLPGLGVGQTEYHPLAEIEEMNPSVRRFLDLTRGWGDRRRMSLQRILRETLSSSRPPALEADLWSALGSGEEWLLRYPLLLQSRQARDEALMRLTSAGLGASPLYARPLSQIPGVGELLSKAEACPGGAAFAERLLTLPLHADVQERDVHAMCEILQQVGRA